MTVAFAVVLASFVGAEIVPVMITDRAGDDVSAREPMWGGPGGTHPDYH